MTNGTKPGRQGKNHFSMGAKNFSTESLSVRMVAPPEPSNCALICKKADLGFSMPRLQSLLFSSAARLVKAASKIALLEGG